MNYEFSEDIQRGIIYLLKSDREFHLAISNLVKPEFFEFPIHGKIFNAVTSYFQEYNSLPHDAFIIEEVKKLKVPNESIQDYSDEITLINRIDVSSITNKDFYTKLIVDFAKKEAIKSALARSVSLVKENNFNAIENLIREALLVDLHVDFGQIYFEDIEDRWNRERNKTNKKIYKTLLPSLDRSFHGTNGLSIKELAMVVAPPGVGKSLFLANQGVTTLAEGRKVLYISLEMSEDKVGDRFDSIMTKIPQAHLHEMREEFHNRLAKFKETFPGGELVIKEFPTGRANVNTIRGLLNHLWSHKQFKPDLIILDYLELLRPLNDGMVEYAAQERIAQELRGLAVENQCLIWTATQTNREGSKAILITDTELADSYGKLRVCDFCVSLNQTLEEFDDNRMRCYVIKSRNGKSRFIVPMSVDMNTLRMSEYRKE